MKIKRSGSAVWQGGLKDGKGSISTGSGALAAHPYGFNARFEGGKGTNPEELIGAAHAGCYSMALSKILVDAGHVPKKLETTADVMLEPKDGGFSITAVKLTHKADVPGLDKKTFQDLAAKARDGCLVSKVLNAEITLDATLVNS
jgi:osmotically inducible protein OsmC